MIRVNWKPEPKALRQFGAVLLIGFALVSAIVWRAGHPRVAAWLAGAAFFIGVLAMVAPRWALPFYWAWMGFGFVVGSVVSRVLLAMNFYLVITPLAVVFRLAGRDALRRRRPKASTYWVEHPALGDKEYFERLF